LPHLGLFSVPAPPLRVGERRGFFASTAAEFFTLPMLAGGIMTLPLSDTSRQDRLDSERSLTMLSRESVSELRTQWLPNITDAGLDRLIELLEQGSPLLVHGCFTRSLPMGCLATHAAWHHPRTAHLTVDAGINWLHLVAGLNPATSNVISDWDTAGPHGLEVRFELLQIFKDERAARRQAGGSEQFLGALVEV
jgi:hypothetical protein